jgi:DNA (cytosine-5)-methyltransferase 1
MFNIELGSLFAGIGGFDLAADKIGWNIGFHSEIKPFGSKVLNYYWPNVPNLGDITKAKFHKYANQVDVISGGFPCQPFSHAGARQGTNDHRYLWPEYLRAIQESRPSFVVGENVAGITTMAERELFFRVDSKNIARLTDIDVYDAIYTRQEKMLLNKITEDLEKEGYEVQSFIIPAAGVGAPHKRDRVWIVAYSDHQGYEYWQSKKDRRKEGKNESEGDQRERVWRNLGGVSEKGVSSNSLCQRCQESTMRARDRKEWSMDKDKQEGEGIWCEACGCSIEGGITANSIGNDDNTKDRRRTEKEEAISGINREKDSSTREPGRTNQCFTSNFTNTRAESMRQRWENSVHGFEFNPDSNKQGLQKSQQQNSYQEKSWEGSHRSASQFLKTYAWDGWPTQSPICGRNDGLPDKLDSITFPSWRRQSLEAYGNAIVPQIALEFFKAIDAYLTEKYK